MTTHSQREESGPLTGQGVCLPCARIRPAKIEQHHVASRATVPDLTVSACRRHGAYCHDILTEQQRAHGTPRAYDAEFTTCERDIAVINGTADLFALTLRHAAIDDLARDIEDLARDATHIAAMIDPTPPPIDTVAGPDPRRTANRRAQHPPARTAAKRFDEPRRRQPPGGHTAEQIDQIRFDQFLQVLAQVATALLGRDDELARDLRTLADHPDRLYRGLQLLIDAGKLDDFRLAGAALNGHTRAATAQLPEVVDLDGIADLLSAAGGFVGLWPVVFGFLINLAAVTTSDEAIEALEVFQVALPPASAS